MKIPIVKMASRSPSRRSTPLSHSRDSSHRSPSFGLRGNTRRGRSPPVEPRRRKVIPRSGGPRSSEATIRGQRGAEFRSAQRSIPPASYQQGHFSPGPSQPGSHSPRRPSVSKRRSFTPPISAMPSASGKRKHIPRMRSSSSSSSSLNSPPRLSRPSPPLKMKKISVERMPPSREPVMVPVRKENRSKSPLTERGALSRGANRFGARASGDDLKKEIKGSSYAAGRSLPKISGQFSDPPRQVENPQKRFVAEPVRRYSGEDDSRPVYRGPDGKGPTFDQHELKKITVGIHRSIPANELQIHRQIFNPEDVVVVRRP
ncbi:hypothetical protein J437_LFUL001668, partial [Ladona fulva]